MLNPIAFSIGPLMVHWYGIIIGIGMLLGLMLAIREGKRFGVSSDFFMDLALIGVPSALIGARAYYVAFKWNEYRGQPLEMIAIWHGGIAIYGGLLGAIAAAIIFTRRRGYSFWRIADICAPGLITGQMIGRWGNFMNQEVHGGPVTEHFLRSTLHLPDWLVNQMNIEGVYFHPTFLYESFWSFTGLILLVLVRRLPGLRAGELFMSYLMWYSIGRFFVEGMRTDSLAFAGSERLAMVIKALWMPMNFFGWGEMEAGKNIRVSQLLAISLVAATMIVITYRRTRLKIPKYADPILPKTAIVGT